MLIRDRSNMEKAMDITYQDIVARRIEIEEKYQKRKANLQTDAAQLVKEYIESLQLPGDLWGSGERKTPYVQTGFWNSTGNFERRPVRAAQLDENCRLKFIIATAINTSVVGGEWVYIPVTVWTANGYLNVAVSDGKQALTISSGDGEGRFLETAAILKQEVMQAMQEPGLL